MSYYTKTKNLAKGLMLSAVIPFASGVILLFARVYFAAAVLALFAAVLLILGIVVREIVKELENELIILRSDFNKQLRNQKTPEREWNRPQQ